MKVEVVGTLAQGRKVLEGVRIVRVYSDDGETPLAVAWQYQRDTDRFHACHLVSKIGDDHFQAILHESGATNKVSTREFKFSSGGLLVPK
jgi:hypothetical protein